MKTEKNRLFSVAEAAMAPPPEASLLVMAGSSCNNRCLFCSARSMREKGDRSSAEIARELMKNRPAYSRVEFIGGEFTVRPDAAALVRTARKLGYGHVALETNGKMFAYPEFSREMAEAGLSHVTFSVHGARAATHDNITGSPGGFEQAMRGLANAAAAGLRPGVTFVVTRLNYREIPEFARRVSRMKGVDSLRFSMVRPVEHFDRKTFMRLVPRFAAVLPYIRRALRYPRVAVKSFPPCLAPAGRIEDHREKLLVRKDFGRFSPPEGCYGSIRDLLAYGRRCGGCALKGRCLGVWKKYLRWYGEGELKPAPPGEWSVYMLRCSDGSLYAGSTGDLRRRLAEHNAGRGARYTRSFGPCRLAWSLGGLTKPEALRLEARLKRLPKAAKEKLVGAS